jgi:hypothetical protein
MATGQRPLVLRPDELIVLETACRARDDLARLEGELAAAPNIVQGSTGQLKVHPLFGEVRSARALVARLLAQLDIPDPDIVKASRPMATGTSTRAQKAAAHRWEALRGAVG